MTGQDLLDRMELLNQELQLQSGEANVARGLLALNVAQDYFESLAASRKGIFGSAPVGSISTTANQEHTTFPSGLLRLDRLQHLDTNGDPDGDLLPLRRTGGHGGVGVWPLNLVTTRSGKPSHYWANGVNIYWAPKPDGVYSVRYYGFASASNITASGTFAYPDIVSLPLAGFAVRLYKGGVDDPAQDTAAIAQETFRSVLDTLEMQYRDGAVGLTYTQVHTE